MRNTKSSGICAAWGDTNPGRKRSNNEDRIFCDPDRGIFIVVDGMGGEAAGEVAAQQAVDFIRKRLSEPTGTPARRLREAVAGANNEIFRLAQENPEWRGMACVLTSALIEDGFLHIGHVGDSRLYKIQNSAIVKVTPDHSPVGSQEDAGQLTELEAMRHPRRNEVFRDVGSQLHKPDDDGFVEYLQIPFERTAAYVLCSDGLSDMLTSKEILDAVVENAGRPEESVRRLIEKANDAGGKDNISAIVVEGPDFSAAVTAVPSRNVLPASRIILTGRSFALLLGRWAFMLYGLAAGLLLSYLLLRFAGTGTALPSSPAVHLPSVLRVAPGSQEFASIASALNAAQPGDRIEVEDGEYEEAIRLKEGVEVAARTPGKAVLRITRPLPDTDAAITASDIGRASVAGLVVKSEPAAGLLYGIKITNSNVTVSYAEISGAKSAGLLIDGSSAGVISGSYIHANAGFGVLVAGEAKPLMIGNLLYANGASPNQRHPGLSIKGNSNPEVKRNVFSGNGAAAILVQKDELKGKMMDNLFINSGRPGKAVMVEK